MKKFIDQFLKINDSLIVPQSTAEEIAELCLPLFFDSDFPKEEINWGSVYEHTPTIWFIKRKEINQAIVKYITNTSPDAWYLGYFRHHAGIIDLTSEMNLTKAKEKVDFEMLKTFINNLDITNDTYGYIKNAKLFFKVLSKSSSFAHKAHKELNR